MCLTGSGKTLDVKDHFQIDFDDYDVGNVWPDTLADS